MVYTTYIHMYYTYLFILSTQNQSIDHQSRGVALRHTYSFDKGAVGSRKGRRKHWIEEKSDLSSGPGNRRVELRMAANDNEHLYNDAVVYLIQIATNGDQAPKYFCVDCNNVSTRDAECTARALTTNSTIYCLKIRVAHNNHKEGPKRPFACYCYESSASSVKTRLHENDGPFFSDATWRTENAGSLCEEHLHRNNLSIVAGRTRPTRGFVCFVVEYSLNQRAAAQQVRQ